MNRALTLQDINSITGFNSKMLTYPELEKYDNIFEIFKDLQQDHFILLYQTAANFGHWCLCFLRPITNKNNNKIEIEFYDPYGDEIDKNLSAMKEYYQKLELAGGNVYYPHLTRLILNTPNNIKIHYNNYKHQKLNPNIATCGRHCAWRLKNYYLTIDQYSQKYGKKHIDKKITNLTNNYLL
jgi:hypothetical protein